MTTARPTESPPSPREVDDVTQWRRALDDLLSRQPMLFRHLIVVDQTESTQEEARRRGAAAGTVVIARRQTAGRGRFGRRWLDERGEGVALTAVIESRPPEQQPRLSIAAAVAAALAIESLLHQQVQIKWPNDVVVMRGGLPRKLAGVLIEQDDRVAMIGIGINVLQSQWPAELRHRAISLRQLGSYASRLDVVLALIGSLDRAMAMRDAELIEHFNRRDAMCDSYATFQVGREVIAGRVLRIDPLRGLSVLSASGERWLPAATTTVCEISKRPNVNTSE